MVALACAQVFRCQARESSPSVTRCGRLGSGCMWRGEREDGTFVGESLDEVTLRGEDVACPSVRSVAATPEIEGG